jgi:hypothetical protein
MPPRPARLPPPWPRRREDEAARVAARLRWPGASCSWIVVHPCGSSEEDTSMVYPFRCEKAGTNTKYTKATATVSKVFKEKKKKGSPSRTHAHDPTSTKVSFILITLKILL